MPRSILFFNYFERPKIPWIQPRIQIRFFFKLDTKNWWKTFRRQFFEMQKSKSKLKVTNENDVKSSKLPRSIQKSDNILGNTCKSSFTCLIHNSIYLIDIILAQDSIGWPEIARPRPRNFKNTSFEGPTIRSVGNWTDSELDRFWLIRS